MTKLSKELSVVASLAMACAGSVAAHSGFSRISPSQVSMLVTQVGSEVLPYQAVRVRIAFRNLTEQAITPGPRSVEKDFQFVELKRPTDGEFRSIQSAMRLLSPVDRNVVGGPVEHHVPMPMKPHGQWSVSFPIRGALWANDAANLEDRRWWPECPARALFPKPGTYTLRFHYQCDETKGLGSDTTLVETLAIDVKEPPAADKPIVEALEKDPVLFAAMMGRMVPDREPLVPKLQAIVRNRPESTYTPYAKLALARLYKEGVGAQSRRVGRAMAADELESILDRDFPFVPAAHLLMIDCEPTYGTPADMRTIVEVFQDAPEWRSKIKHWNRRLRGDMPSLVPDPD
jgi:hypothetical protein